MLRQFLQERFSFLQIFGVKPFGEPIIDRSEQFSGFRGLALLLPQTAQARGGTEFEGFRLLLLRNLYCSYKTFLSLLRHPAWDLRLETWGLGGGGTIGPQKIRTLRLHLVQPPPDAQASGSRHKAR